MTNPIGFIVIGFILISFCHRNKITTIMSSVVYFAYMGVQLSHFGGLFVGFFIAPFVMQLTYFPVFAEKLPAFRGYSFCLSESFDAIFEEILWRDIMFIYIINYCNAYMKVFFILVLSFVFVEVHKVTSYKKKLEMYLYSLLLYGSCFLLWGLHYGLHIGRNCYVKKLHEREK